MTRLKTLVVTYNYMSTDHTGEGQPKPESNSEKKIAEYDTIQKIVNQLGLCNYECEGGTLINNVAFIALQRMAQSEGQPSETVRTEEKWIVKSHTSSMGETGDHDTTIWLQKGKDRLIACDDLYEDDLQEIADQLNNTDQQTSELRKEVESLKYWNANKEIEASAEQVSVAVAEAEIELEKKYENELKELKAKLYDQTAVRSLLDRMAEHLKKSITNDSRRELLQEYESIKKV